MTPFVLNESRKRKAMLTPSVETNEHPPLLELTGIGVEYGAVRALDDVSMAVHAGEVVAVMGPTAPASPRS